ncbi:MAG: shikimate kinase [Lachnospiraceae bacterium]|nr:shikimate kinase [Lachnospiraceae bacterium]MEE3462085.1 shikimate kinase [Lachnospiraceae bacterium]
MKNICLIGMPGSGKSTVGVVLAKRLCMKFIDSDLLIQERTGKALNKIISESGIDGFNKIEEEVNSCIEGDDQIIATGGSVIYGQKAMEHLKEISTVIYLKHSLAEISKRVGDLRDRGVAIRDGQTLDILYDERVPLYEKYADIVIDCEFKNIRDIVLEIADMFE